MIGGMGNPRGIIGLCFGYFRTGVSVFKLIDASCMPISWRYYRPMRSVEVISASQCRWARIIASDRGVVGPFRPSFDPGLSRMMKTSRLARTPIGGEMPAMPSSCPGTKAAAGVQTPGVAESGGPRHASGLRQRAPERVEIVDGRIRPAIRARSPHPVPVESLGLWRRGKKAVRTVRSSPEPKYRQRRGVTARCPPPSVVRLAIKGAPGGFFSFLFHVRPFPFPFPTSIVRS